ncbi:type IV secretory system conjugative DNA transfer family protein [Brevundimonas sp. SORGH_AS_0993]|uniref:type IV secretory system conjugative DNA transfer family protein n=1 Tax=Brevundimonas sp. SORGH_AS_0993 TaxID=3041794 RepID=UPI0027882E22|nr:type IV secretory system conjugative DNA transfer family protein [Brevundimonas sp. SORGH_AS_0993]MDQ1153066.1 type IV secretion system protein VirD4 [Brevundimonas sp. SORGH_AS_0993]
MTRFASASPGARAAAVAVGSLAAVTLLAVLAALIALVGLGQFSGAIDPARVPGWFWYYRQDPEVRRWLTVGVSVSALLGGILVAATLISRRRPLHGAARWASGSEQRRAGLRSDRGIVLGRADGGFLIADGPEHVMLYAPTRTGKGVGVVIPNLLAWPDSVVVLDIKRENFLATAGYRAEAGQTVHLFDPLARDGRTARFNPLGHVDRTDPVSVLDELQRMAVMLFPVHDRADPFWAEAARTGFIGVGGYVAATPERPFTLGEIFRQLTAGDARARLPRIVAMRDREGRPLPGPVVAALTDFTSSSENTFASVRQSITTRMGLWLNPRVDAATAASDFDLRDLRGGRLTLYLGATPDNMLRVQPLYALLFQQLVDLNSRALPGLADRTALIVLDEFARLGPAPVLAHAFAWVAGYGLRLLAVLQSPSQLRAIYGPDVAEEVMTNCGVEIVFAPKELKIAQELSDRLGAYTTEGRSRSRPTGLGAGRRSTTVSDQRRALMLPQELMQLPQSALIVLKAGLPPVRGRKIAYFRERVFQRRLRPAPDLAPVSAPTSPPVPEEDPMDFDVIARTFAAEGLPPPPPGADEDVVGAWLNRVVDTAVLERKP